MKISSNKRYLSAYEKNQLLKYNVSIEDAENIIKESPEIPVEYITGFVDFCGSTFSINNNTLIPRVETEELVEMIVTDIFETIKTDVYKNSLIAIADVGTGSGAIGLSITKKLLDRQIKVNTFLLDISKEALEVAEKNSVELDIPKENIKLIESDLLNSFPFETKLDIIVANLPYIPQIQMADLDASVINHEPLLALDGGISGMELIDRLLTDIKNKVSPNGVIYLELDETHTEEDIIKPLLRNFKEDDFTIEMYKDQFGRNRFSKISFYTN